MQIILEVPDSIVEREVLQIFKIFAQRMLNRLTVGKLRYGPPTKKQKYHNRLLVEATAYHSKGNAEQLFNIANYCVLEWIAPSQPKHHFDNSVDSVTRKS